MTLSVHTSKISTQRAHRFPSILALTVLVTGLVAARCDVVDSNVPTAPEATPAEARYILGVQPPRWITPIDDPALAPRPQPIEWPAFEQEAAWPVSALIGTWALVTADVHPFPEGSIPPQISFREDGIFTGYAACYSFSGRYRAGSDWRLAITDFRANHKFCVPEPDPIREVFLSGLQQATDFRFEHGTLRIVSQGDKRARLFIFERME